jgi:hypothetical protein
MTERNQLRQEDPCLAWAIRTLRTIADRGRAGLGDSYPEIVQVISALKAHAEVLANRGGDWGQYTGDPALETRLAQDESSGSQGRAYNKWHASRPDAKLNAREAAEALATTPAAMKKLSIKDQRAARAAKKENL